MGTENGDKNTEKLLRTYGGKLRPAHERHTVAALLIFFAVTFVVTMAFMIVCCVLFTCAIADEWLMITGCVTWLVFNVAIIILLIFFIPDTVYYDLCDFQEEIASEPFSILKGYDRDRFHGYLGRNAHYYPTNGGVYILDIVPFSYRGRHGLSVLNFHPSDFARCVTAAYDYICSLDISGKRQLSFVCVIDKERVTEKDLDLFRASFIALKERQKTEKIEFEMVPVLYDESARIAYYINGVKHRVSVKFGGYTYKYICKQFREIVEDSLGA